MRSATKRKLSILVVAEGRFPDVVGGAETFIHGINQELLGRGHRILSLTRKMSTDAPDYEVDKGVEVYRYLAPPRGSLLYLSYPLFSIINAWRVYHQLSRRVPLDVLILHHPFPPLGILSFGRSRHIKTVFVMHGPIHREVELDYSGKPWLPLFGLKLVANVLRIIERWVLRRCDRIVTLSQFMKDQVIRFHGVVADKISVVPGGVDTTRFYPCANDETKRSLREKLRLPTKPPLLLTIRRLVPRCGLENLINAMALMGSGSVILLIGGDGPLRRSLDERLQKANLQESVCLLGFVREQDLPDYYRAVDAFVLPSKDLEGFGFATIEALASGIPVLGTPVGGTVEILSRLSKCLLFSGTNSKALAEGMTAFLETPSQCMEIGKKARQFVMDNYTWTMSGDRMEALLKQLVPES